MAAPSHGRTSKGGRGPEPGLGISSDLCLPPFPLFPQVNGVLMALPISVAGGQLSVTQGVSRAVLATDFGLRVSYDWDWRVEVTLPSSYHGVVCGLCGNMDRNPSNDQAFPNGTLAPSIPVWGGSWRVPGWDPLCWDECQGSCPTCAEDRLEEYTGAPASVDPWPLAPEAPSLPAMPTWPLIASSRAAFWMSAWAVGPRTYFARLWLPMPLPARLLGLSSRTGGRRPAAVSVGGQSRSWGQGSCLFGAGLVSLQSFWVCLFGFFLSVSLFLLLSLSLLALVSVSPFDCLSSSLSLSLGLSLSPALSLVVSVCLLLPYPQTPPPDTILSLSFPPTPSSTHRALLPRKQPLRALWPPLPSQLPVSCTPHRLCPMWGPLHRGLPV